MYLRKARAIQNEISRSAPREIEAIPSKSRSIDPNSRKPEINEESIGEAMARAIAQLSEMSPPDLLDRLDWRLQTERRRLAAIPLTSVGNIEMWREGWRILIAEIAIDRSREGR